MFNMIITIQVAEAHPNNIALICGTHGNGSFDTVYIVCPKTLRQRIPGLHSILDQTTGMQQVAMEYDKSAALGLVFHLAHNNLHLLPGSLNIGRLVELTNISAKYGCMALTRSYVRIMLTGLSEREIWDVGEWSSSLLHTPTLKSSFQQLLFVAWEFGFKDYFTYAAKQIVLQTAVINDGLVCQEMPLSAAYIPQHVVDYLSAAQKEIIACFLEFGPAKVDTSGNDMVFEDDPFLDLVDPALSAQPGCSNHPAQTDDKAHDCDANDDSPLIFPRIKDCPYLVNMWRAGHGGMSLSQFAQFLCDRVKEARTTPEDVADDVGHGMHRHIEEVLAKNTWVDRKQKVHFEIFKAAYGEATEGDEVLLDEELPQPPEEVELVEVLAQFEETGQEQDGEAANWYSCVDLGGSFWDSACAFH